MKRKYILPYFVATLFISLTFLLPQPLFASLGPPPFSEFVRRAMTLGVLIFITIPGVVIIPFITFFTLRFFEKKKHGQRSRFTTRLFLSIGGSIPILLFAWGAALSLYKMQSYLFLPLGIVIAYAISMVLPRLAIPSSSPFALAWRIGFRWVYFSFLSLIIIGLSIAYIQLQYEYPKMLEESRRRYLENCYVPDKDDTSELGLGYLKC